jgi:hypothetical protein
MTTPTPIKTRFKASCPTVYYTIPGFDPIEAEHVNVLAIEDNFGLVPSKALLRVGTQNGHKDTGPQTLNSAMIPWGSQYGTRISIIDDDDNVLFLGNVLKRHDQGGTNSCVITAVDDRIFLTHMFVRGCLVADVEGLKYIRGFIPRTNPNGYWNCTPWQDPSNGNVYPVFAPFADIGITYQSPEQVYTYDALYAAAGTAALFPWTSRFWIAYLQLLANIDSSWGIPGVVDAEWRSLTSNPWANWDYDVAWDMQGWDSSGAQDPLDKKMPDKTFRGQRMSLALKTALDIAGTHDLQLSYTIDSDTGLDISLVNFLPVGFSGGETATQIPCVMGGVLDRSLTVHDFDVNEDASDTPMSALVDGATIHVETTIANYDGATTGGNLVPNALIPAWTTAEELAFKQIITGKQAAGDSAALYASYPPEQGQTNWVTPVSGGNVGTGAWVLADGVGDAPAIRALTPEAVQYAWTIFPRVYKAFTLDSGQLIDYGIMAGVDDVYSDTNTWPVLIYNRPLLPSQLQFLVNNPGGSSLANWLKEKYPIRMQYHITGDVFYSVPDAPSIRTTGNGVIFFEGLDSNLNGREDCIYANDLFRDTFSCYGKSILLNAAMPMDHRVQGTASVSDLQPPLAWFVDSFVNACGGTGGILRYVDSPDAYHEDHQVWSSPAPVTAFIGGTTSPTNEPTPFNRLLPPGTEQPSAMFGAQRALYGNMNPERNSVWRVVGIRPSYRAGMWIDKVVMYVNGAEQVTQDYVISAPLGSVLYDFTSQETVLGGLLNAIDLNRPFVQKGALLASDSPLRASILGVRR